MIRPAQTLRLLHMNRVLLRHGLDEVILATHILRPLRFLLYLSPWYWLRGPLPPYPVRIRRVLEAATQRFVAGKLKALEKCVGAVQKCEFLKPGDAQCSTKACAGCSKQIGTVQGLERGLLGVLLANCAGLSRAEILDELRGLAELRAGERHLEAEDLAFERVLDELPHLLHGDDLPVVVRGWRL